MNGYGLAIDIGTTNISAQLINLASGKTIGSAAAENKQPGNNLISRLSYALKSDANLMRLKRDAAEVINAIAAKLCSAKGINTDEVTEAVVVGNTAMVQLFLGMSPEKLAFAPYVSVFKGPADFRAGNLQLAINKNANVHMLPIVGHFVGSDLVADIVACGLHEKKGVFMLVDVGTNTEVFVTDGKKMLACSCASGPAFEGYGLEFGMRAVPGAVESVNLDRKCSARYKTVGREKALGLCGSGAIDAIAELVKCGVLSKQGSMRSIEVGADPMGRFLRGKKFTLVPAKETEIKKDITISQEDVREIQLAKAAVYAGCRIAVEMMHIGDKDIDTLFVAGTFGNHLNVRNAKRMRMLPDVKNVKLVKDAAVTGARMCLAPEMRKVAQKIAKNTRSVELANNKNFTREFLKGLEFG
jgi:uncharacterized 2Fe-2S/4Fe-4S cluster protein (DUF4445 family)